MFCGWEGDWFPALAGWGCTVAAAVRATTAACDIEGEGMLEADPMGWGHRASPPPAITGVRSAQMAMDFILGILCSSHLARGSEISLSLYNFTERVKP
jgi:hypothetical protein